MSPEAEKLITDVINEVNRKSLYEAKLEGKEEVARNLKRILNDEEISKHTGLRIKRIQQL